MDNLTVITCVLVLSRLTSGIHITVSDLRSGRFLTRCVTRHADFMNITCPSRHVMLAPKLIAGYSESDTCMFNRKDCLGMSTSLEKESQACANQKTCTIKLRRILETLVPLPGQRKICKGKPLTYVSVILPKCVAKNATQAMCSGNEDPPVYSSSGIIDSSYNPGQTRNTPCIRRFGSTGDVIRLTLNFMDLQVGNTNRPKIVWTSERGKLRKRTFKKKSRKFSETGSKFELEWHPRNIGATRQGFVVSYDVKQKRTEKFRLPNDQPPQTTARPFVRASLENSMTWNDQQSATLSCPSGKVIYSPDINVTSRRYRGCKGLSPYLLVQRNECYWQRNCTLSWRGPAFLTMTSSRCFGRGGDILISGRYQCVKKDNIVNVCDTGRILKSAGMVRSHSNYPWHYARENKRCRLRIKIGRGRQMKLQLDDVDIDDERDSFVVKHIRKDRKATVIIRGNGGRMSKTLLGGAVEITLSVKRHTKSGSGFALRYKRIPKNRKKSRKERKLSDVLAGP